MVDWSLRTGAPLRWRGVVVLLIAGCLSVAAIAWQAPSPVKVDSIVVLKKEHMLELLSHGQIVHSYRVALGRGGLAPKEKEGDKLTPEGRYTIDSRNGASRFYKALHISYPDAKDRERAAKLGVSPGGEIMIHGLPNGFGWVGSGHRLIDWTSGCIAVTDSEMDEIWQLVPTGTPVEIRP